ncbi:MAG: DUF1559 domain-containing protein, partial [Planctomycetota bacterium]
NNAALATSVYEGTADGSAASANESRISWAGVLTPFIERNDLWDDLVGTTPGNPVRPINLYVCPSDTDLTTLRDNAGLSYVANTGAWDFDDSGVFLPVDAAAGTGDTKDNGVFFNRVLGSGITMRMGSIDDGGATTLMLSENIHKNENYSWLGVAPSELGEQQFGMVWITAGAGSSGSTTVDTLITTNPSGSHEQAPLSFADATVFPANTPGYVRPASNHASGAFNVVYADSHAGSLNADLDYIVYQQLMTTKGRRCVDPVDHTNTADEPMVSYRNAPPISEADFQ